MNIRAIAETASRKFVFRRSFSSRFANAKMLVSTEGGLRYWRFDVEKADPTLLDAVTHLVKPDSVAWDIGANVGLFSVAAAALAGPRGAIVSVDADVWATSLVARSIELNGDRIAPIHQVTAAVSNFHGTAQFHIAQRSRSSNFLAGCGASQTGGSREVRTVATTTLDRLAERFPLPSVLKIDVEGAEWLALDGGRNMIAAARPAIFCEVVPENALSVSRILIDELKYRLFDISRGFEHPKPVRRAVWNTLALPA